jgi:murein hydrolase activator
MSFAQIAKNWAIIAQKKLRIIPYFLSIFACLMPINPLSAQSNAQKELQRLENEKAVHENRANTLDTKAKEAQNEIVALSQKLVEAGQKQQQAEKIAEATEARLLSLRAREKNASAQFAQRKEALENVVVALIAVEKDRPPAIAVRPDNATEAARVAILMGLVAPQLNAKAAQISQEIGKLRQIRQELLMGNIQYRNATQNLENARKTVSILINQRKELIARLNKDASTEREKIAQIAQKASGLRDLIAKLGEALPQMEGDLGDGPRFAKGFANARGNLLLPANGLIVSKYGANLDEGGQATGITIRTRQAAQVVAPYDGKIEFAAPFRAYGRVLIINVGDKYRMVLAGLGTTFVEAGQEVLAGEPLGEMAQDNRIIPDLYVEIRHENETLNPLEWLKTAPEGQN